VKIRVHPSALAALTVTALCWPATSVAAPPDEQPVDPAPAAPGGLIPPLAAISTVLGQSGSEPAGPLGLPDLSAYAPSLLLAQNSEPAPAGPPGETAPAGPPGQVTLPSLSAFNPGYLVPLNLIPASPGQGEPAPGIGPSAEDPSTGRIAFLRRLHEMYEAGLLDGALLGQRPAGAAPG
jgi:hypothetical protein